MQPYYYDTIRLALALLIAFSCGPLQSESSEHDQTWKRRQTIPDE